MHIFDIEVKFFKVLIKLSAATDFLSLCVEYISIPLSSNHNFIDWLQNLLPLGQKKIFFITYWPA